MAPLVRAFRKSSTTPTGNRGKTGVPEKRVGFSGRSRRSGRQTASPVLPEKDRPPITRTNASRFFAGKGHWQNAGSFRPAPGGPALFCPDAPDGFSDPVHAISLGKPAKTFNNGKKCSRSKVPCFPHAGELSGCVRDFRGVSAFLFPGCLPMRWISGAGGPGGANRPTHPPSQNCTGESYRAYQAGGGGRSHGISFFPDHMRKQVGERVMVPGERAHVDSVEPDGRAWGAGCFRFPMDRLAFPDRELRPLPQSIASGKGMATRGAVCGLNVGEFRCQNSTRGKSSGSWPDTRCFPRREGALRRTGPASASDSPPTSAAPQSD